MSNETLFFVLGSVLVVAALGISLVGLRSKEFPPRPALLAAIGLFAALVIGTATYSVLNAEDEQEHRDAELAKEEQEATAEEAKAKEAAPTPAPSGGGAPAATTLALTSPEDGSLSFSPDGLEAPAGNITLEYDNPSPVGHNIAVESEGEIIGQSDTIMASTATLDLTDLAPGEYTFFCSIPGHREGGMEGDLTVTGPEKP